jgi:putative mRNA 3-end processing factor
MPVELRRGSLHLTGTKLWFDARRKSELSFVSHAHSDHIARHESVLATKATLALMEHRLGAVKSALPITYNHPFELGPLNVELFPAGHVLGSAQIRVTRPDGHRIVYTGDLNCEPSLTAEAHEVAECDTLVLESTFGHPRFKFPPKAQVWEQIEAWVRTQLAAGVQPVIYGYALGKSQEVARFLHSKGLGVCAHASIHAVCEVYSRLGVSVPTRLFDGAFRENEVGLFPPYGRSQALKNIRPKATAVCTGWAMDPDIARRYGADIAFALSDHADCASLVAYAKATGATEVLTHHGYARELAQTLRDNGVFARAVSQPMQLALPL